MLTSALACAQDTCIIIGGDDRALNFTTLVNGLQTAREYDSAQEIVFLAQNLSSPRWCGRMSKRGCLPVPGAPQPLIKRPSCQCPSQQAVC